MKYSRETKNARLDLPLKKEECSELLFKKLSDLAVDLTKANVELKEKGKITLISVTIGGVPVDKANYEVSGSKILFKAEFLAGKTGEVVVEYDVE